MIPYIYIFGHQIPMYSLCIIVGAAIGILVAVFRSGLFEYRKEDVLYASIYGMLGLAVGGKILYLLTMVPWIFSNIPLIFSDIEYMKALMSGGFVFYGGFLGAMAGILIYAKQYKMSGMTLVEIVIPSVPLIHTFGRIGCFCAGCCYGRPFPPPVGMMFQASGAAPHDITLFPIQLVEAALNLILFISMMLLFGRRRTRGEAASFYMICYGVLRFCLEFFRYDRERGFLLGLSTSQWISIAIVLAAGLLMRKVRRGKA